MNLLKIFTGTNGSKTLLREDLNETYHSRHGAIPESMHVFIKEGLHFWIQSSKQSYLNILEIGFGTGLNAILTLMEGMSQNHSINYHTLETNPLSWDLIKELEYEAQWTKENKDTYRQIHQLPWNQSHTLSSHFSLHKFHLGLQDFTPILQYDVIFFDAFAPEKQPELWEQEIFDRLFFYMNPGAVLVTYSSKGAVRRRLMEAGFKVEKIAGPPYKRHMLRAKKFT